jgi:hypothetical protein
VPNSLVLSCLVTQQRQFDEGFTLTLEGIAERVEGRSSERPIFGDSVADQEGKAETYPKAPERMFSDRDSTLRTGRCCLTAF